MSGFKSHRPCENYHEPSRAIAYAMQEVEKDMAFATKNMGMTGQSRESALLQENAALKAALREVVSDYNVRVSLDSELNREITALLEAE